MFVLSEFTKTRILSVCLTVLLGFMLLNTCDATFDVHIIYFKLVDAGDIDIEYHDRIIKDIQVYYRSEVTRHGFTDKTFPLELDDQGKLIVHTIESRHNSNHYRDAADIFEAINDELPFRFIVETIITYTQL